MIRAGAIAKQILAELESLGVDVKHNATNSDALKTSAKACTPPHFECLGAMRVLCMPALPPRHPSGPHARRGTTRSATPAAHMLSGAPLAPTPPPQAAFAGRTTADYYTSGKGTGLSFQELPGYAVGTLLSQCP